MSNNDYPEQGGATEKLDYLASRLTESSLHAAAQCPCGLPAWALSKEGHLRINFSLCLREGPREERTSRSSKWPTAVRIFLSKLLTRIRQLGC